MVPPRQPANPRDLLLQVRQQMKKAHAKRFKFLPQPESDDDGEGGRGLERHPILEAYMDGVPANVLSQVAEGVKENGARFSQKLQHQLGLGAKKGSSPSSTPSNKIG